MPAAFVASVRVMLQQKFSIDKTVRVDQTLRIMCYKSNSQSIVDWRPQSCYCPLCTAKKWKQCGVEGCGNWCPHALDKEGCSQLTSEGDSDDEEEETGSDSDEGSDSEGSGD